MNPKKTGELGEQQALVFLSRNGYQILETNWFYRHKEIDIIAIKNNTLCFIEVKTRKNLLTNPRDAVTQKKQKNLILAANAFIKQKDYDLEARFDIIEVIISQHQHKIKHIKEAFHP